MKLKEKQIQKLGELVLKRLTEKNLIKPLVAPPKILESIIATIVKDLKTEDDIDAQARKLLDQYRSQAGSDLDERQMFLKIKKQLAKEKNIVL